MTKAELQRLRSLRDKKNREALGLFVVESEKVVGELLATKFPLVEIYATPEWRNRSETPDTPGVAAHALPREAVPVTRITASEMARASHFPTPSTVLAVGRISRPALVPGALDRGFALMLDRVQDAGNVGALLRIADWFAFDRVIMSPDCADVFHQKVINASMGSFARIPAHTADLAATLGGLRERSPGIPIIGCDLDGDDVHTLPPLSEAIVVIGSEGRGLSPDVAAHLTRRVTIPRYGNADSLNAAIAAAIVCDNLRRTHRRPT